MIIKILCIGLVTIVVSAIVKHYRPDLSLIINICGGVLISLLSLDMLSSLLDGIYNLGDISITQSVIKPLTKVLGVGYITEFCSDMADDAGNKTIASKVILGGKIAICLVALPVAKNMLVSILSLLQ